MSLSAPRPAPGGLSFPLVVLLALAHCAAFADYKLPAMAAPLLKSDLGLSDGQIGLLLGPAFVVLYAVGMLATFPLASSPHRFRWLAGCIATWMIGMVGFALARSFEGLCIARALVGLGQAAFQPLALGLIVEDVAPRWRARSIAVFTAGSVIGRSMALLLGGAALALLDRWLPASAMAHWRWLFLIMAVPNLVLIGILLRCRERPPLAPATTAGLRQILAWLRREPGLMGLYLCGAIASVLVVQTVGSWAPSILQREHGLVPAAAAMIFGVALLIASPTGHLLAGSLIDARGKRVTPTTLIAGGLLLVVPMLWAVPHASSATMACGLLALISLAGGAAAVAALAGLPQMLPVPVRAAAIRLFLVFTTVVGVGLGPFFAGLVSDGLGAGGNGLSTALYMVCAIAAAVGLGAALLAHGGWRRVVAQVAA